MLRNTVPHRVQDATVLADAYELVRVGDQVQVRVFSVVEVSVWFPDLLQHAVAHSQCLQVSRELQTPIDPTLPEVAVQLIRLKSRSGYCACARHKSR